MKKQDRRAVKGILADTPQFTRDEFAVAMELIDIYLKQSISSGYHIFVAEETAEILGYVCFGPTPLTNGTWDLYWIAVRPSLQKRGIGRELLVFAENRIAAESGRLILIETSSKPAYTDTRRFYDRRGYSVVAWIDDYYAPGDHKLIFRKQLGQPRRLCAGVSSISRTLSG